MNTRPFLLSLQISILSATCVRQSGAALNQKLSEQRAQVVQNYLQSKQVPHNFFSEGLGFSQPLPGANPASSLNQRTVIRLVRIGS